MGDPCGIRGFGEGEKHKIKQIIKKYKRSAKSEKKKLTENDLKRIAISTKRF